MINLTNTLIPEQLPKAIGIVIHINRHGEAVALTASSDVSDRCNPAKMERLFNAATEGDKLEVIKGAKWYTDDLVKYPEAFKRLVFIPMPTFEDADRFAKILRKSMQIQATNFYDVEKYLQDPKDEKAYEQALIKFHSDNQGYVDGLTALKAVGFEKIDYSNGGIGWQGMKGNSIHRKLCQEGVLHRVKISQGLDEERSGRVAVYGYKYIGDAVEQDSEREYLYEIA